MNNNQKVIVKKPEGYNCFACGTANPIGLNLEFYAESDKIFSEITPGKYHVGWADIIHGGIISTLLDEVMSWTILYFKRIFFVLISGLFLASAGGVSVSTVPFGDISMFKRLPVVSAL